MGSRKITCFLLLRTLSMLFKILYSKFFKRHLFFTNVLTLMTMAVNVETIKFCYRDIINFISVEAGLQ